MIRSKFNSQSSHYYTFIEQCPACGWPAQSNTRLASGSHGFPSSDINHHQKRAAEEEAVLFPLGLLLFFLFFCSPQLYCLDWLFVRCDKGSQAGEFHPQLLLPTALHCSQSPSSTYNRIWIATLCTQPGESCFSFPLPHLDPLWLHFCRWSRHHTYSVCSPPAFCQPQYKNPPQSCESGWSVSSLQRALTAHLSLGSGDISPMELGNPTTSSQAAAVQPGALQWALSPAQSAEPLSKSPHHGHGYSGQQWDGLHWAGMQYMKQARTQKRKQQRSKTRKSLHSSTIQEYCTQKICLSTGLSKPFSTVWVSANIAFLFNLLYYHPCSTATATTALAVLLLP